MSKHIFLLLLFIGFISAAQAYVETKTYENDRLGQSWQGVQYQSLTAKGVASGDFSRVQLNNQRHICESKLIPPGKVAYRVSDKWCHNTLDLFQEQPEPHQWVIMRW